MYCASTVILVHPGWGLQAQEHATLARGLLPSCSSSATEKLEVLLSIHLTHGGASLMAAKYPYDIWFTFIHEDINVN